MVKDDSVVIESTISHPVENVWVAWTDPVLVLKWFGSDPNGTGVKAKMDVRPGGSYEVTFKDGDQTEHTCHGLYKEVKEFSKLSFTWTWKSEPSVETFVAIQLTDEGNGTKMRFQHSKLGTASAHNYEVGWQNTFAKLEQMLKMQKTSNKK
jgi:uncharacterized protein YndB with AHSA1/START domain